MKRWGFHELKYRQVLISRAFQNIVNRYTSDEEEGRTFCLV